MRPTAPSLAALTALLAAAPLAAADPDRVIDLADPTFATTDLLRVYGSRGEGIYGVPLTGGGDCDGDGIPDAAVAYLTADRGALDMAGEVDLVLGDGTVRGWLDTAAPNPRILRFLGSQQRELAGSEVWMDDVTGDGVADLLICRQSYSYAGRTGAGALTIVVGGNALRTRALAQAAVDLGAPPPGLTLTTLVGAKAYDRLCIWVRSGDVTGDGVADLVVGADQEDAPGEGNRGAAYVVRGGSHLAAGGVVDLASFGTTALAGHLAKLTPPAGSGNYHLGGTCQIADLDGNFRGEVLVAATLNRAGASLPAGSPAQGSGGYPRGRLYIAWDSNFPAGVWSAGYTLDLGTLGGGGTVITGGADNHNFGEELVGGVDFDGNGELDLFVGDLTGDGTGGSRPFSGLGHVFFDAWKLAGLTFDLDTLPLGLVTTRILGPSAGAIGADTAAVGDCDGDGYADLAFASPHANPAGRPSAGTLHVLFGHPAGWPATVDLAPGNLPPSTALRISEIRGAAGTVGNDGGDTLAYSAAAGDLDGDGRTDLLFNEMRGNGLAPGTIDVGNLLVLTGRAAAGGVLFADGFESGDTARWPVVVPPPP